MIQPTKRAYVWVEPRRRQASVIIIPSIRVCMAKATHIHQTEYGSSALQYFSEKFQPPKPTLPFEKKETHEAGMWL